MHFKSLQIWRDVEACVNMIHLQKVQFVSYVLLYRARCYILTVTVVSEMSPDTKEKWEKFTTGTLAEVNKKNTVELVSTVSALLQ